MSLPTKRIALWLIAIVLGIMVTSGFSSMNPDDESMSHSLEAWKNSQTEQKSLNLSSSMFGLFGPISANLEYSDTVGLVLQARIAQALGLRNAVALELDGGAKEWRVNGTYGFGFTPNNRIKVSAEYLSQRKEYTFASGPTDRTMGQTAIGATYQYVFDNNIFRDIYLNAFYSHTPDESLDSRVYTGSDGQYINDRRISGGYDKSISMGTDISPSKSTIIGGALNYDNVNYDGRYQASTHDSGLGVTLNLHQLLGNKVKLNILASDRQYEREMNAGFDFLLNKSGNAFIFNVTGTRILGKSGLSNDSRFNFGITYTPDSASDRLLLDSVSGLSTDLTMWTKDPAVHMNQVLAVVDQDSRKIVTPTENPKPLPPPAANNMNEITVSPNQSLEVPVKDYLPQDPSNYRAVGGTAIDRVEYDSAKGEIVTSGNHSGFTDADVGKTFTVELMPASNDESAPVVLNLKVDKNNLPPPPPPATPIKPNPNYHPVDVYLHTGQSFGQEYNRNARDGGSALFDPQCFYYTVKLGFLITRFDEYLRIGDGDLSGSGLHTTMTYVQLTDMHGFYDYLTISGTAERAGVYPVHVYAQNGGYKVRGWWSDPIVFNFIISDAKPVIRDMPDQMFKMGQSVNVDLSPYVYSDNPRYPVTDVTSDPALGNYGLSVQFDRGAQRVALVGTVHKPMPRMAAFRISAKNDYSQTDGQFHFGVQGPPIKASDIDHKVIAESDLFSVPLKDHFNIPYPDDPQAAVNDGDYDFSMNLPDGSRIEGLDAMRNYLGRLSIINSQIQGVFKDNIMLGEYVIHIKCHNSYGSLMDADGNPAEINFPFQVIEGNIPQKRRSHE